MDIEYFRFADGRKCDELMEKYPDYSVFWQSGLGFRGASEHLLDKQAPNFKEEMKEHYDWSANISIDVKHSKKELHFNGFSCLDME